MQILKYLQIALRGYDSFGVSFDFNIKGKKQFQSIFGGILSVLMSFILLVIFISGVISVIQREKFQINVQQKQTMNPEYNEMNISNFMFAIKLDDPFKTYFPDQNKTAFSMVVNQVLISTAVDGTRNKTVISQQTLEKCEAKHFGNVDYLGQEFVKTDISDYLCLPLNYTLKLQGNFNSDIFYYPTLKISFCKTEDCYTNEQIAPYASDRSFMVTLSTLIQSATYIRDSQDNQVTQTLNSDFFLQTSLLEESKADLYMQNNQILVNNNIISLQNQYESKSFWSFSIFNFREYKQYHATPDTIFTVNFRISPVYEETKKSVNTIDDFLSYFGGLLKIISSIFGIIALKYNELGLRISVANHLYQFNVPKKVQGRYVFSYENLLSFIEGQINRVSELQTKLKNHTKNILQTTKYMKAWITQKLTSSSSNLQKQPTISNNQQIEQFQIDNYVEQLQSCKLNFLQELIAKINETGHDLKLGLNFFIYELLCCSCCEEVKQTRKMLKKCEKVINQDLDIIHLLKKIQEIDKLKQILLVEDQIKVFNYTPKPVINLLPKMQKTRKQSMISHSNSLIHKVKQQQKKQAKERRKNGFTAPKRLTEIYESYSKIKETPSPLNERIIELLGPTIELIFRNYYSIQKMAQKFIFDENEKLEQIQPIINQDQDDKQIIHIAKIQNKSVLSHQLMQVAPKLLHNDQDQVIED